MSIASDIHLVCEAERIHIPGAIQPHGAVIVLSKDLVVRGVSKSIDTLMGCTPSALLGQPIADVFGPEDAHALQSALERYRASPARPAQFRLAGASGACAMDCRLHGRNGVWIVDCERSATADAASERHVHDAITGLARLRDSLDVAEIAHGVASVTRAITGFDRVLVYRFDSEWNGEVIAEAAADGIPSYLGLRFPASDIPRQARDLYVSAEVRHIPDALYAPSTLIGDTSVVPVDLGGSCLRSVSPVHLEYMKNMGVRASLVGSLLRRGTLWGLVACHHLREPRYIGGPVRDVFNWICQDASTMVTLAKQHALVQREGELAAIQSKLLDACRHEGLQALIEGPLGVELTRVAGADGFAWLSPEGMRCVGLVPHVDRLKELQQLAAARAESSCVFASHALAAEFGRNPLGHDIAGALVLPSSGRHGMALAWFRAERRHSIRWGGDPNHPVDINASGQISPRKSFELFLETIEGQAQPWAPEEIASASRMEELVEIEVQRRLESKSVLLQTALGQLNERVIVTDADTIDEPGPRIIMVTDAVEQASGYRADELIGATPRIFQGPLTDRETLRRVRSSLARGERIQVELVNYTKDGRGYWIDLDVAPITRDDGTIKNYIAVQRDITERKENERQLVDQRDELRKLADLLLVAKQAADRANEAKSVFLTNMSHELRTPMHAILSFAKLGFERVDPSALDKLKRYFANIRDSGERLTALLNDLLDLAKLEAGRMEMQQERCDLADVIGESAAELEPLFAEKSLRFEFVKLADTSPAIIDRIRIGQVIRNLLSNAIKFSPSGGRIRLALGSVTVGSGRLALRLTVEDEGMGIPDGELESVFDKFIQSSKTQAGHGGTGLGLAICREIVGAHDGTIRALPTGGRGSLFEVVLPSTD